MCGVSRGDKVRNKYKPQERRLRWYYHVQFLFPGIEDFREEKEREAMFEMER